MDDNSLGIRILIFLVGMFFGVCFRAIVQQETGNTYEKGQIDAINGKIKYQKEVQPDSSVIWVEIKSNIK